MVTSDIYESSNSVEDYLETKSELPDMLSENQVEMKEESETVSGQETNGGNTPSDNQSDPQEESEAIPEQETDDGSKPYYKKYYLLYGGKSLPEGLDLSGTKDFLSSLGLNGGELKQAREGLNTSELNEDATSLTTDAVCSYCGRKISMAAFYKMKDGRMRCTKCSRSLVEDTKELKNIYDKTLNNLADFFGIELRAAVNIEMVDSRKLKKKLKNRVGEIDTGGGLILGVAIRDKNDFAILLENGAPRITVIATIAHELTHVWQYTNWKDKNLKKKYGKSAILMLREGMAMWTEIQYLFFIGETEVASRLETETRNRSDIYGTGFVKFADAYPISKKVMEYNETPFMNGDTPL